MFILQLISCVVIAAETKLGIHPLTIPEGYVIEQVCVPPMVDRPINMAFDEAGALYVTDGSGSNAKPEEQVKNPTHRVMRLVDKLSFPEGTMWLEGLLYVAAPPVIWKLTDADADGVAEKRGVWFDGVTLTGCANDLHGPYAGPDGFIYWCKGAFAEQRHRLADGRDIISRAAHLFRARPDGSGWEVVITGGMDNPADVVFSATGERFLCGTFFVNPRGGQREGKEHLGILRNESQETITLATGPTTEVRIPRADVAAMAEGAVSLMPPGLDASLTPLSFPTSSHSSNLFVNSGIKYRDPDYRHFRDPGVSIR